MFLTLVAVLLLFY